LREEKEKDIGSAGTRAYKMASEIWRSVQEGKTEKEAFEAAEVRMAQEEEVEFNKFRKMVGSAFLDGGPVLVVDRESLEQYERWKSTLSRTPYHELSEGEKGLMDRFLTHHVLGWDDTQAEMRMKNMAWVFYLLKLRDALFPSVERSVVRGRNKEVWRVLKKAGEASSDLPKRPFFYESYQEIFARSMGSLGMEGEVDRWVFERLRGPGYKASLSQAEKGRYLERMRAAFFPHLIVTDIPISLPTVDKLKEILYKAKIGYRKRMDKLEIRRFYKLPSLLFSSTVCSFYHLSFILYVICFI